MSLDHLSFADLHAMRVELNDIYNSREPTPDKLRLNLPEASKRVKDEIIKRVIDSALENL